MREIILDTETTGLDPADGHRVIEIGCLELVNHIPTGQFWHEYFNPERDMPEAAFKIHGLSASFLQDKPSFAERAAAFLSFIEDAQIVIHNAAFDTAFLEAELARADLPPLPAARVVDTLSLARRKHPAGPNSLDALCRRYGIDNSARTKHGALLDCELLAEVYLELIGGRQANLTLVEANARRGVAQTGCGIERPAPLPGRVGEEDRATHRAAIAALGANAIWLRYQDA
jgi:DNA polymerase-3 subunit epsilon